jgi:hypothetical protein
MLGLVIGDGGDVVRIDGEELVQASTVMATVTKGASILLSMIITINAASAKCWSKVPSELWHKTYVWLKLLCQNSHGPARVTLGDGNPSARAPKPFLWPRVALSTTLGQKKTPLRPGRGLLQNRRVLTAPPRGESVAERGQNAAARWL